MGDWITNPIFYLPLVQTAWVPVPWISPCSGAAVKLSRPQDLSVGLKKSEDMEVFSVDPILCGMPQTLASRNFCEIIF